MSKWKVNSKTRNPNWNQRKKKLEHVYPRETQLIISEDTGQSRCWLYDSKNIEDMGSWLMTLKQKSDTHFVFSNNSIPSTTANLSALNNRSLNWLWILKVKRFQSSYHSFIIINLGLLLNKTHARTGQRNCAISCAQPDHVIIISSSYGS